jgi:tryptophan-rich sensory protein
LTGTNPRKGRTEKEGAMLWTIAEILLVLWAVAMFTAYTAGGFVHLLLVIAVIVVVFQFIGGRRAA